MVISLLNISSPLPVQCWDMKEQLRAQTIGHFRDLCIKTRLKAQLLIWKWFFILMQINLIFTRKVVHLASFWEWGFLAYYSVTTITRANSTIISTWSDVISLNCWRVDFHLVKCFSNCQFILRIMRFFTKRCDSRSIMRNRNIAECQKPCIRGGATWCYSRHLSKLGNCFDEWTTGSNRQRRIMNPYRSPHRTDNTQTTSSPQTEGTSKNSRRFAHGKYGGGKVILLYSEDTYLLGFGKQWPPNDFQIWPSSPCMATETLFVGNLWRCTLDEWRRLYFWTTHLFLLFCSVSSICTVTVSNSSLLNRHVLEQTYIGQLKIN